MASVKIYNHFIYIIEMNISQKLQKMSAKKVLQTLRIPYVKVGKIWDFIKVQIFQCLGL